MLEYAFMLIDAERYWCPRVVKIKDILDETKEIARTARLEPR